MPLFICSSCDVVDNSATGEFWSRQDEPLCAQCATGVWHGRFSREPWDGETKVRNPPWGEVCSKCGNGPVVAGERCYCGRVAPSGPLLASLPAAEPTEPTWPTVWCTVHQLVFSEDRRRVVCASCGRDVRAATSRDWLFGLSQAGA